MDPEVQNPPENQQAPIVEPVDQSINPTGEVQNNRFFPFNLHKKTALALFAGLLFVVIGARVAYTGNLMPLTYFVPTPTLSIVPTVTDISPVPSVIQEPTVEPTIITPTITKQALHSLDLIAEKVGKKLLSDLGQPYEGFEATSYLSVFPMLKGQDFHGVKVACGMLVYANGVVTFEGDNMRSDCGAITHFSPVLINYAKRMGFDYMKDTGLGQLEKSLGL